jgi:putative toxin-antitoxin system antitoxin component (TIGR02293 family)
MTGSGGDGGKCSGSGESALGEPFGPPGNEPWCADLHADKISRIQEARVALQSAMEAVQNNPDDWSHISLAREKLRRLSEVIRILSLSGKTGIGGSNIHTIEQRMFLDNLVELSCRECLDEAEFLDAWKRGVPVIASEVQPVLDDERSTEPFAEPVAGWPDDYSDPELADMIIEGLDKRHIASLVKLGFSASEMRQIGELPMSVISGKGTPERLSAEQGNRVTRMARVATLAIAVFGDCDKAWAWLRASKNRFGNQTCVDVLRTEYGGRSVETLLLRLRHGMAA